MIIGIDIGKNGAICIENEDTIDLRNMPMLEENVDYGELFRILQAFAGDELCVFFEHLTPLHQASKKANWSLADQYGAIQMACYALGIKFFKIPAKVWQKAIFEKLPPLRQKDGTSDTKALALIAAKQLYPNINLNRTLPSGKSSKVIHDGKVDALLIMRFGKEFLKKRTLIEQK